MHCSWRGRAGSGWSRLRLIGCPPARATNGPAEARRKLALACTRIDWAASGGATVFNYSTGRPAGRPTDWTPAAGARARVCALQWRRKRRASGRAAENNSSERASARIDFHFIEFDPIRTSGERRPRGWRGGDGDDEPLLLNASTVCRPANWPNIANLLPLLLLPRHSRRPGALPSRRTKERRKPLRAPLSRALD